MIDNNKKDYNSFLYFLKNANIEKRDKLLLETEINLMSVFTFISSRKIKISADKLKKSITLYLPSVKINSWDNYYYILKKDDFLCIHKKIYLDKLDYIKEAFDCDDFAMLMTILFSSILNVNSVAFALGYMEIFNYKIYHAFNVVILKNENEIRPYIIEPQTGEIKKAKEKVFLGGWEYEIKEIFLL